MGMILSVLGLLLTFVGWIWGVVLGFQKGGALWGILNILLSPLTPLIMALQKKIKWTPVILQIIGIILSAVGPVLFAASVPAQ